MANRFWVGGTGIWDASTTINWSTTTGGTPGASAPGSADAAVLDANSGAGVVTMAAGTYTFQAITSGAHTGTLDLSVNNPTLNLTTSIGWSGSGTGLRVLTLGSATINLTTANANSTPWNFTTTTNLTFSGASSTLNFTATNTYGRNFVGGGLTYGTVTFGSGNINITGNDTFGTLTFNAPNIVLIAGNLTATSIVFSGTGSSTPIGLMSTSVVGQKTISVASGTVSGSWLSIAQMAFTGGATFTFTNSLDLGDNTGATITPPSGGGGGMLYGSGLNGALK